MYDSIESQAEAMSCTQIEHDQAILSDQLYTLAMQMTDLCLIGVDDFIRRQCYANQIEFPPKQITGSSAPANADNLAFIGAISC